MAEVVERIEQEEPPLVMPDPQPAFHALDKYRSVIGGHGPRSDEEITLCDEAHDALELYFAAKDATAVAPMKKRETRDSVKPEAEVRRSEPKKPHAP